MIRLLPLKQVVASSNERKRVFEVKFKKDKNVNLK